MVAAEEGVGEVVQDSDVPNAQRAEPLAKDQQHEWAAVWFRAFLPRSVWGLERPSGQQVRLEIGDHGARLRSAGASYTDGVGCEEAFPKETR